VIKINSAVLKGWTYFLVLVVGNLGGVSLCRAGRDVFSCYTRFGPENKVLDCDTYSLCISSFWEVMLGGLRGRALTWFKHLWLFPVGLLDGKLSSYLKITQISNLRGNCRYTCQNATEKLKIAFINVSLLRAISFLMLFSRLMHETAWCTE